MRLVIAVGCICSGQTLAAAPCVGTTFDLPFPDATNVETRLADAPSPQFPGIWQEGLISGWPYRLFANGDGDLRSDPNTPLWEIAFICQSNEEACSVTQKGTLPDGAARVATNLQNCMLGLPLVTAFPVPAPDPVAELQPETELENETADESAVEIIGSEDVTPEPCGVALVSGRSNIADLQELITLAGEDAGPADGIMGPQTRDALTNVIGETAANLDVPEAIAQLDKLLCERTD